MTSGMGDGDARHAGARGASRGRDREPEPRIRPATLEDAAPIASLSGELGYPATALEVSERLAAMIRDADGHAVFVAEVPARFVAEFPAKGGTPGRPTPVVAWIHVFAAVRIESEPFAELGGLVVQESCRGSGIGTRLVAEAEAWARARGFATLRLRSRIHREAAHRLYRRLGFEPQKTQHVFRKPLEG